MSKLAVDLALSLPGGIPVRLAVARVGLKDPALATIGALLAVEGGRGTFSAPVSLRLPVRMKLGPIPVNQVLKLDGEAEFSVINE